MNLKGLFKDKKIKYLSNSTKETKKLAQELAKELVRRKSKEKREGALIIGLKGELGGGKTTFLQGFANGLGIEDKVLSPTFVLMKKYKITDKKSIFNAFYHLDCYRIKNSSEVTVLNFDELIENPKNILAIEWAERVKEKIKDEKDRIEINFKFIDKKEREIKISLK